MLLEEAREVIAGPEVAGREVGGAFPPAPVAAPRDAKHPQSAGAPEHARRVLDLGAGTGKLTRGLLDLGLEVVAVEPLGEIRALPSAAQTLLDAYVDAVRSRGARKRRLIATARWRRSCACCVPEVRSACCGIVSMTPCRGSLRWPTRSVRRTEPEVVGQMLDYAANGVVCWPLERLRELFARQCERDSRDPDSIVAEVAGGEIDVEEFWVRAGDKPARRRAGPDQGANLALGQRLGREAPALVGRRPGRRWGRGEATASTVARRADSPCRPPSGC